jgi:putative oxidoreductase
MNTALLVLRVVPGILLIGHGLQKLVPSKYSPPLLHAMGHQATASGFEQLGISPGLPAALLAGSAEILGGFSLGAGLLTPVGTILVGAVMTTAILTAHARNGIWNAEGGFEFPLVLLALAFVVSALGAGSYSINAWAHVANWAGIHGWSMSHVARAGIVLAIGAGAGLLTVIAASAAQRAPAQPGIPAAG